MRSDLAQVGPGPGPMYIMNGRARVQKKIHKCKLKPLSIMNLNKARAARAGGTAFKRVLRLRAWFQDPGPTAFKNFGATAFKNLPLLRLRIYKL